MPRFDEADLLAALDEHDRLIVACAQGRLSFADFQRAYDTFHHRWALDGHEADAEERRLLARQARRIEVHRRACDEILMKVCADDDAGRPAYIEAGRFGSVEAVRRLHALVEDAGLGMEGRD